MVAALFATLTNATVAKATEPAQETPGPCRAEPGDRLHDGFFARSGTGLAFLWATVRDSGGSPRRSAVRGVGQSADISIGGTPARGLVFGGNIWTARIDPVFVEDGKTVSPDDDSVKVTMLRLGPFLDWYPDPRRGFHAQAVMALTLQVETDVKGNAIKPASVGGALSIGAGYEWFIASEFSLGLFGRMALGSSVRSPPDGDEVSLWMTPELALSATYH
jgi:hypothetical protein